MLNSEPALPPRMRKPLFAVAAVSAAVVVILGILVAQETTGTQADQTLRENMVGQPAPWHQIALVIDYLAEPIGAMVMFTTLVLVFAKLGKPRTAILVITGPALAVVVTTSLKPLVGREINDGFLAYPSGHTATLTGVALVVMMVVTSGRRAAILWTLVVTTGAALAMAWAQVVLNAHYPTDTVGGFATALAVIPPTAWLTDRVMNRLGTPASPAGHP